MTENFSGIVGREEFYSMVLTRNGMAKNVFGASTRCLIGKELCRRGRKRRFEVTKIEYRSIFAIFPNTLSGKEIFEAELEIIT